jgi:hypothetical protein
MANKAHSNLCTAQMRGIHLTIRNVLFERGRIESKVLRRLIACPHASDAVHKEACDRVVQANALQQQLEILAVVHECPQLDCLTEQPFDAYSCVFHAVIIELAMLTTILEQLSTERKGWSSVGYSIPYLCGCVNPSVRSLDTKSQGICWISIDFHLSSRPSDPFR